MQWYYAREREQIGPLTEHQFSALLTKGDINATTLVWHEGMDNWVAYGTIAAAPAPAGGKLKVAPTVKRPHYPAPGDDVQEATPAGLDDDEAAFLQFGGFWIRFAAKFVDAIILGVVNIGIGIAGFAAIMGAAAADSGGSAAAIQTIMQLVQILISLGYTTFFLGKFGATPGKMIFRLRVVRPTGDPIGYGRACGRYFAEIVSALIFMIGYIMAAFDDEKRALHDRLCDTRVVRN